MLIYRLLRCLGHQRWIPRGRDFVIRSFANPDQQRHKLFDVPFFGLRYSGDFANFIDWSVYFYGAYSINELLLIRDLAELLPRCGVFADIGANVGHHSLFMSLFADRVVAFEPFPSVRAEMERKLAYAGVHNVEVWPVALGAQPTTLPLNAPGGANLGTGTLTGMLPGNASGETIQVRVERGDDLHLPALSLIKVDVEGFELEVLQGLFKTLQRDRPPLLIEITQASHASLTEALYPDHRIYAVTSKFDNYVLSPYRGEGEALIIPCEMVPRVEKLVKFRG